MKTPTLLLLLLAALPVDAQLNVSNARFVAAALPTPAAAGPTYLVNQGFEGTGYDNGETWIEGNGNPDEDYTGVVLLGSQSFRINDAGVGHSSQASFTGQSETWVYFLFRPVSGDGVFNLRMLDSGGSATVSLILSAGGALTVYDDGSAGSASTVSTLSAGTTYHVWYHAIKGTGANGVIDVGFSTTGTRPTSGNSFVSKTDCVFTADLAKIKLGNGNAATYEFLYDHVLVDDAQIGNNP